MSHKLNFRPEINGLRAIAVILVIIFHLNDEWLPMGYLGVDIFFVISGFLITRIILKEIDKGEFSWTEFITRRIKRIFPALFVVLLCSSIVAILVLSSLDHRSFFRSLRYASLQCSNFFFDGNSGYFDVSSKYKPLLHTWSLGVEEQFYLVWPLLLWFTAKLKCHRVILFIVVIISSFIAMCYFHHIDSLKAFYMFYARAWEFAMGGFLALGVLKPPKRKSVSELIAGLSFACILVPMFLSPQGSTHDTLYLLITCFGACGIIYSSQQSPTFVAQALATPTLLYLGLLSYSLYLWHWPIIVFFNYTKDIYYVSQGDLQHQTLGWFGIIVILFLCWILSAITHRWVETPFRTMKLSNKKVMITAFVLVASFSLISKQMQTQSISSWRVSSFSEDIRLDDLKIETSRSFESEPHQIILVGDSHAEHFVPMVQLWAKQYNLSAKALHKGGTPPFVDIDDNHPMLTARQSYHVSRVKQYIQDNPQVEHVFIAAFHNAYNDDPLYEKSLEQSLRFLFSHGKKVCFIAQTPPLESTFLKYLELPHLMNWLFPKQLTNEEILAFNPVYIREKLQPMREVTERFKLKFPQIHIWHPKDHISSAIYQGLPCYNDGHHLNKHGSLYFVPYFDYPITSE